MSTPRSKKSDEAKAATRNAVAGERAKAKAATRNAVAGARATGRRGRAETQRLNDERLLAAGRSTFLRLGFHGASLDAVAAEASLTKGAVYARWSSKAELFFTLLEAHVTTRLDEIQGAFEGRGSPEDAARRLARQWMKRTAADRDWSLLVAEFRVHVVRHPDLLARYREIHRRLVGGVASMLVTFYAARGLQPPYAPDSMARLALGVGGGLALERLVDRAGDHAESCERVFVAIAAGGLGGVPR